MVERLKLYNDDMSNVLDKIEPQSINLLLTDFPYGRSSIKKFTDTSKFQSDFFNEISPILKSHSYFVYMLPKNWINFTHSDFELVDQHEIYIHKKLTRLINVVKKR